MSMVRGEQGFSMSVRLLDCVVRWSATAGMCCLALTAILITADAGGRYLFNSPVQGVHAIVQGFLQPAVIFLAVALAARTDAHLRIELVSLRGYPRLRVLRDLAFSLLVSMFWLLCAWQAGLRAWSAYINGQWPVGEIAVPDVIAYGLTALGCLLAAISHLFTPARNVSS